MRTRRRCIGKLLNADLPANVFLNINFPNCAPDEVEGVTVAAQGKLAYGMWVEERADGRGLPYYWLRFGRGTTEPAIGSDLHALSQRHISVTPLKMDFTAHEVRDELTKALA